MIAVGGINRSLQRATSGQVCPSCGKVREILRADSMRKSLLIAAALLGSTALAAPGFAQDATPTFTLSGMGGVIGLYVPSYNAGAFGHVASGNMLGGMIGVSGQTTVGGAGEWGIVLGINAYGSFGVGMSSWTDSVTSQTTITGLSLPSSFGGTGLSVAAGN